MEMKLLKDRDVSIFLLQLEDIPEKFIFLNLLIIVIFGINFSEIIFLLEMKKIMKLPIQKLLVLDKKEKYQELRVKDL
jgi:hypothetical protein